MPSSPRPAAVAGLLLLLLHPALATAVDIWAFDPDYAPAPAPQDGPPFSFDATRNRALLKWQILGIVGGYVFFVLLLFAALMTVGKSWRRAACQSRLSLAMEMVHPSRWTSDTPQLSIRSGRGGWLSRHKSSSSTLNKSPIVSAQPSFDPAVLEADKQQREDELARIYAQVLRDDDTRSPRDVATARSPEFAFGPGGETVSMHTRTLSNATSTRSFSQRVPPQLRTDVPAQSPPPTSPRSYRSYEYTPTDAATPRSPRLQERAPPAPSPKARTTRSVRNLTISAPMPSASYPEAALQSASPLSPRLYNPGSPPAPPETPATPILDDVDTDDSDVIETYGMEGMDRPRPLPMTQPHRPYISVPPRGWTDPATNSAGSSSKALPLRSYASHSTMAGSRADLINPLASPTKVTMLSPRKDRFRPGAGSARHHPLTAGLPTPYSPYMPQTPMTPVTPHLVNRAERRQRQREAGRHVATEDDLVEDEREVWGGL